MIGRNTHRRPGLQGAPSWRPLRPLVGMAVAETGHLEVDQRLQPDDVGVGRAVRFEDDGGHGAAAGAGFPVDDVLRCPHDDGRLQQGVLGGFDVGGLLLVKVVKAVEAVEEAGHDGAVVVPATPVAELVGVELHGAVGEVERGP